MKFTTFLMIAIAMAIGWGLGWHTGKGGSMPNLAGLFPAPSAPAATTGTPTVTAGTANLAPPPPGQVPSQTQSTVLSADQVATCKSACGMSGPQVCYRGVAKINACQARCEGARDSDLLDTTCNMGRG